MWRLSALTRGARYAQAHQPDLSVAPAKLKFVCCLTGALRGVDDGPPEISLAHRSSGLLIPILLADKRIS